MSKIRIGVQVRPAYSSYAQLRETWLRVEDLGADTLWNWDHFFPLPMYGPSDGLHFECWTHLAGMAEVTSKIKFGALVTCNSYRNPQLLADMARTVDHMSDGRLILGLGSGWFEPDYAEYGYDFKTAPDRLRDLDAAMPVLLDRMTKLEPGPVNGKIPIMIGGSGEKVTLRIVAQHADMWNGFGTPEAAAAKSAILDEWCAKVGRNPAEIERSILTGDPAVVAAADDYADRGITHIIFGVTGPEFNLDAVRALLAWRDKRNASS